MGIDPFYFLPIPGFILNISKVEGTRTAFDRPRHDCPMVG
jgi:hypothetical protein